jgi:hypothetical protein
MEHYHEPVPQPTVHPHYDGAPPGMCVIDCHGDGQCLSLSIAAGLQASGFTFPDPSITPEAFVHAAGAQWAVDNWFEPAPASLAGFGDGQQYTVGDAAALAYDVPLADEWTSEQYLELLVVVPPASAALAAVALLSNCQCRHSTARLTAP